MAPTLPPSDAILTVSELTRRLKGTVSAEFSSVQVRGELGRVTYHGSGHVYLSLKDEGAVLDAVVWRGTARTLPFRLEQGQEVVASGHLDIYPPRGSYQLIVRRIEPLGEGALRLAFEQLRARLQREGLFDEAHKVELPRVPRRVALVTSRTGAAVRDLVTVMQRRFPALEIVLVPVRVQGEGAAEDIAAALQLADERANADVIVVGRGGGSLEDLWCFNEEVVARAIHACRTPVVSAVGHETDVTIADLVADVRAATPSQAGELVVPDRADLQARLASEARALARRLRTVLDHAWQRVEALGDRPALRDPGRMLATRRQLLSDRRARLAASSPAAGLRRRAERLAALAPRLAPPVHRTVRAARTRVDAAAPRAAAAAARLVARRTEAVNALDLSLRALSPLAVLGRGYSLTSTPHGRVVRSCADVHAGDMLHTRLADGATVESRVETVRPAPPQETDR